MRLIILVTSIVFLVPFFSLTMADPLMCFSCMEDEASHNKTGGSCFTTDGMKTSKTKTEEATGNPCKFCLAEYVGAGETRKIRRGCDSIAPEKPSVTVGRCSGKNPGQPSQQLRCVCDTSLCTVDVDKDSSLIDWDNSTTTSEPTTTLEPTEIPTNWTTTSQGNETTTSQGNWTTIVPGNLTTTEFPTNSTSQGNWTTTHKPVVPGNLTSTVEPKPKTTSKSTTTTKVQTTTTQKPTTTAPPKPKPTPIITKAPSKPDAKKPLQSGAVKINGLSHFLLMVIGSSVFFSFSF